MKKIVWALLVCALFCASGFAKSFKSPKVAEKEISKAINFFANGQSQSGADLLKPYTNLSDESIERLVVDSDENWSEFLSKFGRNLGVELIDIDTEGSSLAQLVHVVRLEDYPIIFRTTLYRNDEGWKIIAFSYNAEPEELFK